MSLAEPTWLCLLVLAPLPWLWERRGRRVSWPTLGGFAGGRAWLARAIRWTPSLVRGIAIACLAVALARPREPGGRIRVAGRGVAIVAILDRSSSMKASDFADQQGGANRVSRLEAAKFLLSRFLMARDDDLVGVVGFANYPDLVAPPTLDQRFLIEATRSLRPAGAVDDGTNIGDAIAFALGSIRSAPTKRKVLILLTDGRNAPAVPRPVDPFEAAAIGRALGVTLHTIAIGRPLEAEQPGPPKSRKPAGDPVGEAAEGPDLAWLRRLAETGGGRAFAAADSGALERVFEEIDTLEKSPVAGTIRTLYRERYAPWVAVALGLLAGDLLLTSGRFRRLP